ncbi:hypothetical protein BOQ63_000380 (plasmid) [Streptomyces viridifaciens]|nr:hypothetical protein BOQ63_000380 [Streptomyces viridifaciens]
MTPTPATPATRARYEKALGALTKAQAAFLANAAQRPTLTGDAVHDTPHQLWIADMNQHGNNVADALTELADAREAAGLTTREDDQALRELAADHRARINATYPAHLTTDRAATPDTDNEDNGPR